MNTQSNFVHHLNKGKYLERKSNAIFCMITHFSKERMREGGLFVFIDCLDCLPKLNLIMYITVVKIVITIWDQSYDLYLKIKDHSQNHVRYIMILIKRFYQKWYFIGNNFWWIVQRLIVNNVLHSFPCFL